MVQFRRSKRRAVSLLEIIIGLPIMLILLFAVVQFGLLQSNQQTLKMASRAGALVAANMEIDGTEVVIDSEIINAIDEVLRKGGLIDPAETITMVGEVQLNYAVYNSGTMMPASGTIPMPATLMPPSPAVYPDYHYVQVTISIPVQRLAPNAMACFGVDYSGRNALMTSLFRHERSRINPIP